MRTLDEANNGLKIFFLTSVSRLINLAEKDSELPQSIWTKINNQNYVV